ncbi:MAG TPA: geranylgeranylglycerol-phosphate geranylgeranyltransferase [Flavobacteriaceae bacterium]|nr:geranylgeranylglycerol-phosphate geranylgeranyltransferase [Flavobacteriaceae bacterium]
MFSRKQKLVLLKFFSLFSVIRGYNILFLIIAIYLTSIYILAPDLPVREVLLDLNLLMLVLASVSAVASGYIINNFYDSEKDLINRPRKTFLDRMVSQRTKLSTYFVVNLLSVIFASYVSFKAVIFFSVYIFFLWFYSHKLKKYPFIGNLTAAILTVVPFFAVFIHYGNFDKVIFVHAIFLFMIISMRELVKDLENLRGDLTHGYQTIPVVYGEETSKKMLSWMIPFTLIPAVLLVTTFKEDIGYMDIYFYGSMATLMLFLIFLWMAKKKLHYIILHTLLRLILVIGVLSIVLIHVEDFATRLF